MAIAVSSLTSDADTTGGTSDTTASISPASNALILAATTTRWAVAQPTGGVELTGNGLTWVRILELMGSPDNVNPSCFQLFRAMGSSPSPGVVTLTAAANRTMFSWNIVQCTGVNTGGSDGEMAVRQVRWAGTDTTHDYIGVRLKAGLPGSATVAFFQKNGTDESFTLGSGYTTLGESTVATPNNMQVGEYRLDFSQLADVDWVTSREGQGIAVEVVDAGQSWGRDVSQFTPYSRTYKTAVINQSGAGENQVIAGVAGKRIKVYAYVVQPTGTVNWVWEEGAENLNGAITPNAREGQVAYVDPPNYLFATTAGSDLGIDTDSAVAIDGWIAYWDDDEF